MYRFMFVFALILSLGCDVKPSGSKSEGIKLDSEFNSVEQAEYYCMSAQINALKLKKYLLVLSKTKSLKGPPDQSNIPQVYEDLIVYSQKCVNSDYKFFEVGFMKVLKETHNDCNSLLTIIGYMKFYKKRDVTMVIGRLNLVCKPKFSSI